MKDEMNDMDEEHQEDDDEVFEALEDNDEDELDF